MPGRAAVFQKLQVGPEATAGTAVAAGKRLQSTGIVLRPREPQDNFRAIGDKFVSDATLQKDMSEGTIRGTLSYNDITYLISSILLKAAVPGTWTFKPDPFNPDVPQTLTVEVGSSGGAEKFAYGLVTTLDFRFTRTECGVGGSIMGRTLTEGATMTATPANIQKANVDPKSIQILIGNTVAGLAQIGNCLEASLNIGNKWAGFYPFDPSQGSFSDIVERAPALTGSLVLMHDSVSQGYMADCRSKVTKFLRIVSNGGLLGGGAGPGNYKFQITLPFQFREPDRGDRDDVFASTWPIQPIYDPTFASAIEFVLTNDLAAL